jgi:hypothetical protein
MNFGGSAALSAALPPKFIPGLGNTTFYIEQFSKEICGKTTDFCGKLHLFVEKYSGRIVRLKSFVVRDTKFPRYQHLI